MSLTYVIAKDGQPLMPTERNGKVYRLLKIKRAKVVRRCPFTIKLLYEPETLIVQEVVLGHDTGSKRIGTACIGNNRVLYQSNTELRTDIKSNMDSRRQARRLRRNRKTRYRKARFLNRRNSVRKDRLPPSVKHKVQAHIDEIEFCKKILPVSKIVLEASQFDTHLLKNPMLNFEKLKHWGYQKGFNYEFSSRRNAILHRDQYKCQLCNMKNTKLEVHHIIYRSRGGTDDETNLITLCSKCHGEVHSEGIILGKKPRKMQLKHATHMSIIRSRLLRQYLDVKETLGYITKENRHHLNLPKDHYIDACVIASGGKDFKLNNEVFYKRRVSKGDYQLSKGIRGEQIIPVGKIQGFRKFDKVKYFGKEYFIKGRRSAGTCALMDIFNKSVDFNYMQRGWKTPKLSNCIRIAARTSCLVERRRVIPVLS